MLMLHAGADPIDYDGLKALPVPRATETHHPIPFHYLVDMVRHMLQFYHHEVVQEDFGVTKDSARFFGLMTLKSHYGEYTDFLALRSSTDKSMSAALSYGSRVFICDNMAIRGDFIIRRKNTVNARHEMPSLISKLVEPLQAKREAQHERLLAYKATDLSERDARDTIVRLYEEDVINVQRIPTVLEQWKNPQHEEWARGKVWTLFNACTWALKGQVLANPSATTKLHDVLDGICEHVH